jgi:glycosyltransferase involved in cell wall biosynthesis
MQIYPLISIVGNNWFPDRPGGLDRYVYELTSALGELDTSVSLYGLGLPQESGHPHIRLSNLADPDFSLGRRFFSAYRSARPLATADADAINIHFALTGLAALPHLPKHVPVTCTFHGPWAIESRAEGDSTVSVWFKHQMEALVYGRCDRFIVLSKAFGEILHREYTIPWEKIHIIPGGVDIQRFQNNLSRHQAREKLHWPQDRFILFTPRRLVHRMGLSQLLSAIAQLKTPQPEIWLAIAGKGPLRATLERQATELGLSDQVKFLGFLPDEQLPIAYQAADLTLMPSQSLEGFGLVLLEALASGTPTLCTPVGGMPDVITNFSPDLITASTTDQAIASTLSDILSGSIALPDRQACRDYAANTFDWVTIAQRVKATLLDQGS